MAKTVEIKIPDDIEYRVIGNAFGILIAAAGLMAGEMVRLRSFDYWLDDIVPFILLLWMAFRIYRNFISTMSAYRDVVPPATVARDQQIRESLNSDPATMAQLTSKTGFTAEQVVEEVAKRIEAQRAEAIKKNKFTN